MQHDNGLGGRLDVGEGSLDPGFGLDPVEWNACPQHAGVLPLDEHAGTDRADDRVVDDPALAVGTPKPVGWRRSVITRSVPSTSRALSSVTSFAARGDHVSGRGRAVKRARLPRADLTGHARGVDVFERARRLVWSTSRASLHEFARAKSSVKGRVRSVGRARLG